MYMCVCSHLNSSFRNTFHVSYIANKVRFISIGYLALFVKKKFYNFTFHILIIDKNQRKNDASVFSNH
jgi:hypothetical protein